MTTICDKCGKKSTDNFRMYKLELDGSIPNKYETDINTYLLQLHFCFEHRKEISKVIREFISLKSLNKEGEGKK